MPIAIYALVLVNVAIGTQGFGFAGLLAEIAHELRVPLGDAGAIVSASAITYAIGAPFAAQLVARAERRTVMIAGLVALSAANLAAAFAPGFGALLALRVAAGVATAFCASMTALATAALAPPDRRGRAFALVVGGLTIAFVVGVPLGSVVGGAFGWRATFVFGAAVVALAALAGALLLPRIPGVHGERPRFSALAGNRVLLRHLGITLVAFTGTFTLVAFLGPAITALTGATGAGVGAYQAFVGLGSFAGLAIGARIADRTRARLALAALLVAMAAFLAPFTPMMREPAGSFPGALVAALIFGGAASLFAIVPVNLARMTAAAGPLAAIALPVNSSLVALGQGAGALVGGAVTNSLGFAWIGLGGAVIALAGALLAAGLPAAVPASR